MKNTYLNISGAAGPRVDGIDVAQLLHDLGEASAASSAVDLFGLCLNAQRVMAAMQDDATRPDEVAWLAAFRKMDNSSRDNMLPAMQAIAKEFPQRPPAALTLVRPDQSQLGDMR